MSLGGLYGPHDAFPIAMGVGWGRHSLGLLRFGRMVTLEPHLYLKVHCHRACQWGNPVVTLFSSTISKSSHGMRNVGSIREQSNASTLIFSEVHCALHGRTKHHDMVVAMSDATMWTGVSRQLTPSMAKHDTSGDVALPCPRCDELVLLSTGAHLTQNGWT